MPESTLSLKLTDLEGEVGYVLGWGRGPDNGEEEWTANKLRDIRSAVETALRMFYFQAQLDPRDAAHEWSFLRPTAELTLASGERTVRLPDDFGGFEGEMAVTQTSNGTFNPVRLTNEGFIDTNYSAYPDVTGRPVWAAERVLKGTSQTAGSRSELYIWPQADAAYTLRIAYYFLPNYLTAANPYPYGGAAHAETFKAAARAAAEMVLDGEPGPEMQNYMVRLAASIAYDRRHRPKTLGRNTDRSRMDRRGAFPQWYPQSMLGWLGPVTYDGTLP